MTEHKSAALSLGLFVAVLINSSVAEDVQLSSASYATIQAFVDVDREEDRSVYFVDDDAAAGGDGLSWNDAFNDLQDALAAVNSYTTEIRVAQGTYTPGYARTDSFALSNGVAIRGGYRGVSGGGDPNDRNVALYETILSGDLNSDDDLGDFPDGPSFADNAYHVVTGSGTDASAILDGFTITAGNDGGSGEDRKGGGMYNYAGSPTVYNCTFRRNWAYYGGGMYNYESSPTVVNCVFSGNSAYRGGGMRNYRSSSPTVTNCTFRGNSASDNGGGMCNYRSSGPTLTNCILRGNTAPTGPQVYDDDGTASATYSCIQGGWPGEGNIGELSEDDPLFVDADGADDTFGTADDDMHLAVGSPCIDAGDNRALPGDVDTDLDGDSRFVDDPDTVDSGWGTPPIVDMGAYEFGEDCNGNGVLDDLDIGEGTSEDCNNNIVPDECEVGGLGDCNTNGVPDICDVLDGTSEDCNSNNVPDECEPGGLEDCNANGVTDLCDIFHGTSADCNSNDVPDYCDVIDGVSEDCNVNQVPDECESGGMEDCNTNGVSDLCDIFSGVSENCNANDVPDECEPGGLEDCNANGTSDLCDIFTGVSEDCNANDVPDDCEAGGLEDCNTNGVSDLCDIFNGTSTDCNTNDVPDVCDVLDGASDDCNVNRVPDECEPGGLEDCNTNGVSDLCDIFHGTSADCNSNGVPDLCEILDGTSEDCNANDVPDECEIGGLVDCNTNGVPDLCDIFGGTSEDCDTNDVPDECEPGGLEDCNTNGVPDLCDIFYGASEDCDANDVPDECEPGGLEDCNTNGVADLCDIFNCTSAGRNANGIPDECEEFGVIFVDCRASEGGNGWSWDDAFNDLQDALAEVDSYTTEIRVAQGTYIPGDAPTDAFALRSGIAIRGGYRGVSGGGDPDERDIVLFETILSGDLNGNDDPDDLPDGPSLADNAYHVVTGSGTDAGAILDGFTITAGNAYEGGEQVKGAGMYNLAGSPTVTNCTFSGNSAGYGGGMYNRESSPSVTACVFSGNPAWTGGGMYNCESSPTVTNCTFSGNSAGNGGGMRNDYSSSPTVVNCTFSGNSASTAGGGMYNDGNSNSTVINCTFSGNWAYGNGSEVYGGYGTLTLTNCVVWTDKFWSGPQILDYDGGTTTVTYSCIQGGWPGEGNIGELPEHNPLFIDADGADGVFGTLDDDLRLAAGSPCIDAGDNAALPPDVDTGNGGLARFRDDPTTADTGSGVSPIVDMGAFEHWLDCNGNDVLDVVETTDQTSDDCNGNHVPDDCEPDDDCNGNSVQDICDISAGTSEDCDGNYVPDECEPDDDCNGNEVQDFCDIAVGTSSDHNANGVPDECEAEILYVDQVAGGLQDGSSWIDAYNSLQDALGAADAPLVEIHVAQGTYRPGDARTDTFALRSGIAVRGGYRGVSGGGDPDDRDIGLFETILSGDLNGNDDPDDFPNGPSFADNAYHVVTGSGTDASAILDGFTITAGNAYGSDGQRRGAGMYNLAGSPTVTNCTFSGNSAGGGGGMYNRESSPSVTACVFTGNSGGGMSNYESSPSVTGCVFSGNSARSEGGGMDNFRSSSIVTNCVFTGNSAGDGGGMWNLESSLTVSNCTFSGNRAYGNGSEFYGYYGTLTLTNCVVWTDKFWSGPQIHDDYRSTTTVTYSCIQGGWPGEGNIGELPEHNPLFIDADGADGILGTLDDDLRLAAGSPCIDAGNNAGLPPDVDTDHGGLARFRDDPTTADTGSGVCPIVDMGAFEHWLDCNGNDVLDVVETTDQTSDDCNGNYVPDDCEPDDDCNGNSVQDICDISAGTSEDCDGNYVPDECQPDDDCNGNGVQDFCDIAVGASYDHNANHVPDECEAIIIYVDRAADGLQNGSSWIDAYNSLQDALWAADGPLVEIHVAQGTYRPGDSRTDTFALRSGIAVRGGYRGVSGGGDPDDRDIGLFETILSGDLNDDDDPDDLPNGPSFAENAYNVVTGSGTDASAILDGFTITAGNTYASGEQREGAGMYNLAGSPTVINCTFSGNSAISSGAGMYNRESSPSVTACVFSGNSAYRGGGMYNSGSSPTVTDCMFSENSARGSGGGMCNCGRGANPIVTGCVFSGNSAPDGGGMYNCDSSPTITDCALSENWATWSGGGMSNRNSSPMVTKCTFSGNSSYRGGGMYNRNLEDEFGIPMVRHCTFTGNSVGGLGGGVYNRDNSPILSRCVFTENWARGSGGGMYSDAGGPTVANCTFRGNWAESAGGIYNGQDSEPTLTNCTFSGNSAERWGGGGMVNNASSSTTVTNCTFTENSAAYGGGISNGSTSTTMANCIVWGNAAQDAPQIDDGTGEMTATYSCIQGGWPGEGNIGELPEHDPRFVDAGYWDDNGTPDDTRDDFWVDGDYHLAAGSSCIDAGDNTALPGGGGTDLDGRPRFRDDPDTVDSGWGTPPIVDMGAYEYWADCNENGILDSVDIAQGTSADCNENGTPDECELEDGIAFDCNDNGVLDECDLADGNAVDCDMNGVPDECQEDVDSDGLIDPCDNCGKDYNPDQSDRDRDGVGDVCDNCPGTFNPEQVDQDGNGLGDACDARLDLLPDQCPNCVNTHQPGTWLPVAVVGTEAFHVRRIDLDSIFLERLDGDGGVVYAVGSAELQPPVFEDVTGPTQACSCPTPPPDGIVDLTLAFSTREVLRVLKLGPGLSPDELRLVLHGRMLDGTEFQAVDCLVLSGSVPGTVKRPRMIR